MADDPYALIATPVDPYADIAQPIPEQGIRDRITAAVNDPTLTPDPQGTFKGAVERFGQGAAQGLNAVLLHPVQTAMAAGRQIMAAGATGEPGVPTTAMTGNQAIDAQNAQATADARSDAAQQGRQMVANPANTLGQMAGGTAALHVLPAAIGAASAGADAVSSAGSAIRNAAIGSPDAAALRGLGVPAGSPKALPAIRAVQGARPYLQGVKSLTDLQAAIPVAKDEIIAPYRQAVDALSNKPVQGPDGPTTVGALDAERSQLSARLRTLKAGGPEAIQLAAQKGMTQAELLARQQAVQDALYPHLEEAGINPREIMSRYSNVAQVGSRVAGKSTLNETPQRYGIGRMANLSLKQPLQAPGEIIGGARDILAGRPILKGSPTDIGIREAFRNAGPAPDLGTFTPRPVVGPAPLQLDSNVPANAEDGEYVDSGTYPAQPAVVTPQPAQVRQLPAQAGPAGAGVPPGRVISVTGTTQPPHGVIPLPAQFGQRMLGSGEGNPQFVTPPASPPPALNPATAQTNVSAGRPMVRPINRPVEPASPPIVVSPEGQARIQLVSPAPETHAFSQKAWQAAHPNGNLKTALKQAAAKGYKIVD